MKALLFPLFLASATMHARLADTPEQLDARYGQPRNVENTDDPRLSFREYQVKGFNILVSVLDGKSQAEIFTKSFATRWIDGEMKAILSANAFGMRWVEEEQTGAIRSWRLGNAALASFRLDEPPAFAVFSRQMYELQRKQEAERLKEP
ncbi:MAG: hypothetical protein V4710_05175 [Verrucomicrobiota bacterium]